jgi:DNA-binding NtrC family response regulator
MNKRPVCLVIGSAASSVLPWLRQFEQSGYQIEIRRQGHDKLPDADVAVVVESQADVGNAWAVVELLRRISPQTLVLLASRAPSGPWTFASPTVQVIRDPATFANERLRSDAVRGSATDGGLQMIGKSAAVGRIRALVERIAHTDVHALVVGESGTGKELVAEMIHRSSCRRHAPFICVNCAAIPDTLLESELFGYQKGAFTGANSTREGKFSEANGGTLFLDEIGDMSHFAQAKILRALETKRIDRLGGGGGTKVDIRVVAATNRDLETMVANGSFRQDLYFRLNVVEIPIPPLRERTEDIPVLIAHFIHLFNQSFGQNVRTVDAEVLQALLRYLWPGNVREMRNLFEAVYVNQPEDLISPADLPDGFKRRLMLTSTGTERDRVLAALVSTRWNKSQAAKKLNWSRLTLYRKMERYRITASPVERHTGSRESRLAAAVSQDGATTGRNCSTTPPRER